MQCICTPSPLQNLLDACFGPKKFVENLTHPKQTMDDIDMMDAKDDNDPMKNRINHFFWEKNQRRCFHDSVIHDGVVAEGAESWNVKNNFEIVTNAPKSYFNVSIDVVRRICQCLTRDTQKYAMAAALGMDVREIKNSQIPWHPEKALETALEFRREWIRQKFLGFGGHSEGLPAFGDKTRHNFNTYGTAGIVTHTLSNGLPEIVHPNLVTAILVATSHIASVTRRHELYALPACISERIQSYQQAMEKRASEQEMEREALFKERRAIAIKSRHDAAERRVTTTRTIRVFCVP